MSNPCNSTVSDWAGYYEKLADECEVEIATRKAMKEKRGGDHRIDWPFGFYDEPMPKGLNPKFVTYFTESLEKAIGECRAKAQRMRHGHSPKVTQ